MKQFFLQKRQHGEVNPWLIALTVMLATFLEVLDTSVANVALPHIAGDLSAGVDESTWVLTSYLVSNAIVLPLTGWLSSLFGRKRFFMVCVAIFTVCSFLCGIAPTLGMLVVFRILQGAGGGALQPISQAILVESFPKEKQGMAMAIYGMGVVVAPVVGPTLGGWITDNYTWRWIFFINIPVGVLSLVLTALLIYDPPYLVRRSLRGLRIDYMGLGLLSVGLGFLQVVLDKGEREDWFGSNFIIGCTIVAAVGLIGALVWELTREDPIVDFRMLKERNFFLATFTMFMLGFVLYGSTVLLPLMLQTLMGYTALLSGLVLSPGSIFTIMALPIVGRLTQKVEARWIVAFGLGITGLVPLAHVDFQFAIGYLDSRSRLDLLPHRHGLPVYSHQRHGVLFYSQGEDEQRHRHHQSGAQYRRQCGHRQCGHAALAPGAGPPGHAGCSPYSLRCSLPQCHGGRPADVDEAGVECGPRPRPVAGPDLWQPATAG